MVTPQLHGNTLPRKVLHAAGIAAVQGVSVQLWVANRAAFYRSGK